MYTKNSLSDKALQTLNFIFQFQKDNGYSPSIEEIKKAIGTKSTRGASMQLDKLNKLGYIKRDSNSRRAIKILIEPITDNREEIRVPIVGSVKAGYGGITEQNIEGYENVPISMTGGRRDILLLRVRGESMLKADINPNDLVIVAPQATANNGDIVVVFDPDDEDETIKRFKKMNDYMILLPESDNPDYKAKIGTSFLIQGKVLGKFIKK